MITNIKNCLEIKNANENVSHRVDCRAAIVDRCKSRRPFFVVAKADA